MRQLLTRLRKLGYMFRALRNRNYRLFFTGQAISLIGLWMTRLATQWLVYRLTGSAWMLGVVGFCQLAPAFVVSPIAGTMVDRWDRKTVLLSTQVGSMLVSLMLAALALGGVIEVWHILLLCAAEGAVRGFDIPARQALVVDLIDHRDDLPNAIALNSSAFNSARMIGPALGGALVWLVGEGLCFLIDGLSYFAVVAALLAMQLPAKEPRAEPKPVLSEMRDGLAYTFGFAPYRSLLLVAGVVVFLGGAPMMGLMSEFAKHVLGGDSATLGTLMGASGAGALVGAIYLATRRSVRGLGRVIAACAMLFGVMLVVFAFSRTVWLAGAAAMAAGFAQMTLMAGSNTIIQAMVDDDKRGRVMSFFVMTFMGGAPLGKLLAGAVAERVGTPWTLAVGGVACVGMGAYFARQLPALRALARPIYIERGIIPEVAEAVGTASRPSQPASR